MFKAIYGARFDETRDRDDARAHWSNVHGGLAIKMPTLRYYVQSHAVDDASAPGAGLEPHALAGYSSEYYADIPTFEAAMKTPIWDEIMDDGPGLWEMDSLDGYCTFVEEQVLVEGWHAPYKVGELVAFRDDVDRDAARAQWRDGQRELAAAIPGLTRHVQNLVIGTVGMYGTTDDPTVYQGVSEWWFETPEAYATARASDAWARLREARAGFVDYDRLPGHALILEERTILVRLGLGDAPS